jgi:hypothetical protein
MGLADVLTDAGRRLADVFTARGALVERLTALRAKHADAGAMRTKALATAQREVDALDEPRRRLERLKAEEFGKGLEADRQIGELENQLRDPASWPRALRVLALDLERFREAWAVPIEAHELHNRLTGAKRLVNLKELEARTAAIALGIRVHTELRDALWQLAPAALAARVEAIYRELAQYDRADLLVGGGAGEESNG